MVSDTREIAIKAQQLLDDALVQQIFATLEARYISDWRNSAPDDVQKREAAHASVKALDDFRARLSSLSKAPKVEAHNAKSNAVRR